MTPKVEKLKPNKHELSKPLKIPECKVKEDEVWYPPDWFLVSINEIMIRRYGGYTGFDVGLEPYQNIIKDAEEAEGIYRKAAILLRGIGTTRIFQDGHHRTVYIVVKTFLEKNDAKFKEKDERKIIRFIKGIRSYKFDEIEGWLENGEL